MYPAVRDYLLQMYAVGYDQGRSDVTSHLKKAVAQYNEEGHCINVFNGFREAVRKTGYSYDNLRNAILNNRPCKGFRWKYITEEQATQLKEANRDKYMY
jgi:thiamine kinase-like enzyme